MQSFNHERANPQNICVNSDNNRRICAEKKFAIHSSSQEPIFSSFSSRDRPRRSLESLSSPLREYFSLLFVAGAHPSLTVCRYRPYDNCMDAVETLRSFYADRKATRESEARERRAQYEKLLPELVQGCREADPDIEQIILFGSLAENTFEDVRDIDIAIRSEKVFKVAAYLLRQTVPIDVVDLDDAYPHIRKRILERGKVLYERK